MSLLYRTCLSGGTRIINLLKVTAFDLKDNKITFHYSSLKDNIIGNLLFFHGGGSKTETFIYQNKEDAERSFNNIQDALNNYYKKG